MYEVLKDLGLCILSLLVKFVAFTANFVARKQPEHYQQMHLATGVTFLQGFVSMKIQRIIWKLHGVSVETTWGFYWKLYGVYSKNLNGVTWRFYGSYMAFLLPKIL